MSDCCDQLPETWYKGRQNETTVTFYSDRTQQTLENITGKSFRMTVYMQAPGGEIQSKVTISGAGAVPNVPASQCTFTTPASSTVTATWAKALFAVDDITDSNNPIYKGGGELFLQVLP